MADFFATLRWPSWEREVADLPPNQGLSLMPPPFTAEGRDLARASRSAVPLAELHRNYDDMADQLNSLPEGANFQLKVTE
jgi:hypothetical protein